MSSKTLSSTKYIILAAAFLAPLLCFVNYRYFLLNEPWTSRGMLLETSPNRTEIASKSHLPVAQSAPAALREGKEEAFRDTVRNEPFASSIREPTLLHPSLPHKILQEPSSVCMDDVHPFAVIGVASQVSQGQRRMFLRSMISNLAEGEAKVVFVMAMEQDETPPSGLLEEFTAFADILVLNNVDTYYGLSNKTQALLTWFSRYCGHEVRYLIKMDDDVAMNWRPLQSLLASLMSKAAPLYIGRTFRKGRVITRKKHRNHEVDPRLRMLDRYPDYNSGPMYVLDSLSAEVFVETLAAYFHDWNFRNEDAMTGLILNKSGILPTRFTSFLPKFPDVKSDCIHARIINDTHPLCACDSWVALHCGSKGKAKCISAWKRSLECNLGLELANLLASYIHSDTYG